MPAFVDIAGKRFGRLTAVRRAPNKAGFVMWECICDCGAACVVRSGNLRNGNSATCGCGQRSASAAAVVRRCTTHGMTGSSEYRAWRCMLERCRSNVLYRDREICDRWRWSFENFFADMGPKPSPKHSLDRIDNDAGYSPTNCRWATVAEQNSNRRGLRMITLGGYTAPVSFWASKMGIGHSTLCARLDAGWSVAKALTKPLRGGGALVGGGCGGN